MEKLQYRLIRSSRRTLAVQIDPGGELIVRAPLQMPVSEIEQFLSAKRSWIEKHLPKQAAPQQKLTEEEIRDLARKAGPVIADRVRHFAPLVGVTCGRITIRNQHTRWGSCSSQGNLNFNCLLMLVPAEVLDYVVVHELCHRKEMNHSARFWAEVERVLPDYRKCLAWLKENGQNLIGRL